MFDKVNKIVGIEKNFPDEYYMSFW
jgi:pimeloyl-ACP methyl ester carboxylesterase